ncbi:hypothetical protein SCARD494_02726 [Seiridium cardinale]
MREDSTPLGMSADCQHLPEALRNQLRGFTACMIGSSCARRTPPWLLQTPVCPDYIPNPSPALHHNAWNSTRRNIVSRWWNRTRELRRKRGVVRYLASTKAPTGSPDRIASAHATSAKAFTVGSDASEKRFGTGASICSASLLCHNPGSLNTEFELIIQALDSCGFSHRYLTDLDRQFQDLAGSMDHHKLASAAKKSSNHKSDKRRRGDQTPEQYIATRKREAVEAIMAVFNTWLDKRLSVISYAYEASDGSEDAPNGAGNPNSGNSKSNTSSGHGRPKRQLNDDDDEQSGSSAGGGGNGNGEDRGGNKRARKDAEDKPLFACPFFQHDPTTHCTHRSCTGPGWPSIHRLKEHLNRIHRLPKHTCPRCREPMPDAAALEEHLRSDIPCVKREVVRVQGIDDAQDKRLKERKKTSGSLTEEQKWRDIYMILFPNANKNALPSPYYDSRDSVTFAKSAAQWKKLRKHISKELPQAVQKRVEQRFEGVEVELLHGLSDIVRDEIFHIFKGFPQGASAPASPGPSSRSASPKLSSDSVAAGVDASRALNLGSFLSDLNGPFSLFNSFNDFDFNQQVDFGAECVSDSGYASNSTITAPSRENFDWPLP